MQASGNVWFIAKHLAGSPVPTRRNGFFSNFDINNAFQNEKKCNISIRIFIPFQTTEVMSLNLVYTGSAVNSLFIFFKENTKKYCVVFKVFYSYNKVIINVQIMAIT